MGRVQVNTTKGKYTNAGINKQIREQTEGGQRETYHSIVGEEGGR